MNAELNKIEVSVVIPWGKVGGNVIRSINSALSQSVQPKEIIVVCNGAVDNKLMKEVLGTIEISIVSYFYLPGCTNANIARNAGALYASSKYLAFLDCDDWWDNSHLEFNVKRLNKISADMIYSGMKVHRKNGVIENHNAEDFMLYENMESYLLNYLPAQTSSYVIRREVLIDNLWDNSLNRHQDYELIARLSHKIKIISNNSITTNVDWSTVRRHKLHRDCFKVLKSWKHKVSNSLYRKHFWNLYKSSVRSFDLVFVLQLPYLVSLFFQANNK